MHSKFMAIAIGISISVPSFAHENTTSNEQYFPQQISAGELLNYCASSSLTHSGRERNRYCRGFISGVEETVRLLDKQQAADQPTICLPAKINARRLSESFVNYARPLQDKLNRPAAVVVIDALLSSYPCAGTN